MKQLKIFILGIVLILMGFGWYLSWSVNGDRHPAEVGKTAPDFDLKDAAGRAVHLSDYRGRFVVLNFWATWCPPCVEEAPFLEQLHRRFQAASPQRIAVLTVSVDSGWEAVNQFTRAKGITFPVLLDTHQTIPNSYGTFKYPETYIIDPAGIVRDKIIGAYNWTAPEVMQYFDGLLRQ